MSNPATSKISVNDLKGLDKELFNACRNNGDERIAIAALLMVAVTISDAAGWDREDLASAVRTMFISSRKSGRN